MHVSKRFKLLAMISLLFLYLLTVAASAQDNLPKFYVKEKVVNVGEVMEGEDVTYDFVIRNMGSAELQIISVRPG